MFLFPHDSFILQILLIRFYENDKEPIFILIAEFDLTFNVMSFSIFIK